jgi:hypothetical protein
MRQSPEESVAKLRGGLNSHEMPAHHKLEAFLDEYIKAAGIGDEAKSPLFRSAFGRTGLLNGEAMHRIDAYRMIQRLASELGMKVKIGCHTPTAPPSVRPLST